jgi:4a-hydroxytetrahydrobiopterin dehydratase|tara:strand:- start:65 stop:328 length:264 start_codon:yes stop_codon:yes gene_type:complete
MDIQSMIDQLDSWKYENKAISKTFKFSSYLSGINFVNKIALLAENMNHHPDIKIGWCKVDILLTTHDSSDVTKKDIELASLCDQIQV